MARTRPAATTVGSGQAHSNGGKGTAVENPPGNKAPPPAKECRRKNVAAPKKRCRGKPGELWKLNLDVLSLIVAYIHPLDMLNLARTCKALRALLMDKSSAFLWRCARRQFKGLPDCPTDLTEPEYAHLVFHARCHGCGKHSRTVFWQMRRRYCPDCRAGRLCCLYSCPEIIRKNNLLAIATLTIEKEWSSWVDRGQVDSFMDEYRRSSDKENFLSDRERQLDAIREHARECEDWFRDMAAVRQDDLKTRRQERATSIFERLEQHGYGPEIVHFGRREIQDTRKPLFGISKELTDKEWNRIWPKWLRTMDNFRSRRMESVVYQPRRVILASEYTTYVTSPLPNTPTFDLLPHAADIAQFPPFQDIIKAPEGAQLNFNLEYFGTAFAQLPTLVDEWRKKLDAELAELVKIPAQVSVQGTCGAASNSITTRTESSQTAKDKLRLACALFSCWDIEDIFTCPEVFLVAMRRYTYPSHANIYPLKCTGSIRGRFGIRYMEEAPYIIRACGLDPNVATVEDMDRRNARIKCLSCVSPCIEGWKGAIRHAHLSHPIRRTLPLEFPRLQIVGDEHMGAVQAAELSVKKDSTLRWTQCLLCRPCVGGAFSYQTIKVHVKDCHHIKVGDIKRGVHWVPLGTYEMCSVEMVEEGGQVTFRPCGFR